MTESTQRIDRECACFLPRGDTQPCGEGAVASSNAVISDCAKCYPLLKRSALRCLKVASVSQQRHPAWLDAQLNDYLVDPASNHMLVSKIKPCMSKYMPK